MHEFRLTSWIDATGVVHIDIDGDLDRSTADRLVNALGIYREPVARCVIDLAGCHFVDSSGLRALLQCQARLEPPNELALVGLRPNVERVLQVAQMRSMFLADATDPANQLWGMWAPNCAL